MMLPRLTLCLIAALALTTLGCNSFDRAWNDHTPPAESDGTMPGRWSGTWTSTETGHTGELRAIITPVDGEKFTYDAWFWAKYSGILTFDYVARLTSEPGAVGEVFSGEADLGKLAGGVYRYDGLVSGDDFDATYIADADEGTFEMTRVD